MVCKGMSGALRGVLLGLIVTAGAAAQSPRVLVSLSGDDTLPNGPVRDQDLVLHGPSGLSHVAWPSETLALHAGDAAGANLLHTVFGDVDAIANRVSPQTAAGTLLISLGSDEAGFKDGDVLGIGAAGFEVVFAEADFVAATGATDANVDVDALQFDLNGTVLFSFGDNEASSFLSGDTPGLIKDGDILRWLPGSGVASIDFNELQVNAMVSQALGAASTTTDTTGLARDPVSGSLLFSVQSPTPQDASVFATAGGGSLVAGQAESDFGFLGAPELDALDVPYWVFPALTVSASNPVPGSTLAVSLDGAQPGAPYILLASFATAPPTVPLSGWGACVLAHDAALVSTLNAAPVLLMLPDALGHATLNTSVPAVFPATDFVLQAVKPGSVAAGSNPLVVEVAQ